MSASQDIREEDGRFSETILREQGHASRSLSSSRSVSRRREPARKTIGGLARRTLGLVLMLITVCLWTASNFLASTIFADNSYSKPYFVTFLNTAFFSVFLLGSLIKSAPWTGKPGSVLRLFTDRNESASYLPIAKTDDEDGARRGLKPDAGGERASGALLLDGLSANGPGALEAPDRLSVRETARLGLEFCVLWFAANYFIAGCLEYTTVASSTILMSTSSVFTLIFGALLRVEVFSVRKLLGVLASLAGIILISRIDLSGETDKNRGDFPHKSTKEIAIGDTLALGSAVLYGIYAIMLKNRIRDESRVDLLLFFGFIGVANTALLWPGFFVLHWTGMETFELPPTGRIWAIVILNSLTSLLSDFCWAYAMLLTSPLVVTVGISLTIPLSLIGQMVLNSQSSGFMYWFGAGIVFLSFIFINNEARDESALGAIEGRPGTTVREPRED